MFKNQVLQDRKCSICSENFVPKAANQLYCSSKCYNKKKVNSYLKAYKKDNYHSNINFKLKDVLRSRLYHAIKNDNKTGSAVSNLGCSVEDFKIYIESLWQQGMSWDNWSRDGWHIDHILPLSSFNLSNEEELKKACHYSNLQPMWAKENISKGGKIED